MPLACDFDFAGLVNAPYAEPSPRFRLRSVRQRLYRGGLCGNNDLLPTTIQQFLDKKDVIYGGVDKLQLLGPKSRHHVISYLDMFYERVSDTGSVQVRLINKCDHQPMTGSLKRPGTSNH